MDNASKALVMVGAILIAVMLISLGVYMFTFGRDEAERQMQGIGQMSVSTFNEKFVTFCGPRVKGSTVKTLINTVNSTKGSEHPVSIDNASNVKTAGSVDAKAYYSVVETYDDSTGYITSILISSAS